MSKMSDEEKALLGRMTRKERAAFLKAHRKPPIPAPRSYNAKESALRRQRKHEKARYSRGEEPDFFRIPGICS